MKRLIVGVLVAAQMLAVAPVFAGSKGRMNTAGVLTGAAVYSWYNYGKKRSTGRRNAALATTGAAAYSWYNYNKAKKAEKRRERARAAYWRRSAQRNKRLANYYRSRNNRTRRYARR
jgi:hypothetical protein